MSNEMRGEMRAVVYQAPGQIALQTVPIPSIGSGDLLVKVEVALTCGTDVKTYLRGHPKFPPPFIFGHEFTGEIVARGNEVDRFHTGQHVTANVFAECGTCFFCQKGQGNLCENLEYNFGAFAEYIRIPAPIVQRNTFSIPDSLPVAHAALLEPLVTVVHGQRLLGIHPGESVAILGAGGPIGLLHQQLAIRAGAHPVIAVGHSALRLEAAKLCGATRTINAHTTNPQEEILKESGGYGVDVVIECTGTKLGWEQSVQLARRGGRVLWFGGLPGGTLVEVDATRVHYGEITLLNVHGGTQADAQEAFSLLCNGAIDGSSLLTRSYPLEEIEEALQAMKTGTIVKACIFP